jgi:EF-P beta-lysylation protein EpmB
MTRPIPPIKQDWQHALQGLVTDPKELFELLALDTRHLDAAHRAAQVFPLRAPRGFVARMKKGDIHDPLLRQVLPLGVELADRPGYTPDALQEARANALPGLLHKYHGRVLLTPTSVCAIHCRYCFRRHFPYHDNNPGRAGWQKVFDYIKQDHTIHEVILSGGDPLTMNDMMLQFFSDQLNEIPHVKTLRIHSRLPIVLPERITETFTEWITQLKQHCVIVVHANHPQELDDTVQAGVLKMKKAGAVLLNQSVLLKDVNDAAPILRALSERLFEMGVLPYYLHTLDRISGAAHFDIPLEAALAIHKDLTHRLPGYLVPKLVREVPGEAAKQVIA